MEAATKHLNSNAKIRGQSAVEYILLLTVIAGTVWLFNSLVAPQLTPILEDQKKLIELRAMRGNPQPVVAAPAVQNYYGSSNKRVEVR